MDQYSERAAGDVSGELQASEPMSRLVAYASPYLFWVTVVGLSAGILMLR